MSLLFKELRAFATFQGLRWAALNLNQLWLTYLGASGAVKAAFLSHMLEHKFGGPAREAKVEDGERVKWAQEYLAQLATKIPNIPVEALSPELAVCLKAWEKKLDPEQEPEALEGYDEWVRIECDGMEIQGTVLFEVDENGDEVKEMESDTPNRIADAGKTAPKDVSHHKTPAENVQYLEQVARQTFEKMGMDEQGTRVALKKLSWYEKMGVEELEDDDDGIEVLSLENPLQ